MSLSLPSARRGWMSLRRATTVTRREIRDTLRDWRLVLPILLLTLVFPLLMQFTATIAQRWVVQYGGELVGERMVPFLLMIVGFFPISFSLVIALETFVGEKERHTLEPLLSTPLTNLELYWGKMLAAMIPPLLASYLGLGVYLTGLRLALGWAPSLELLGLVVLLTTAESLVMVSGAVVISSQTTSVRAANILASFVIIPMALLVQAESVAMFWADYGSLWWILGGLLAADVLLVRMGIHLFSREELLGREIDALDLRQLWRQLVAYFVQAPARDKVEGRRTSGQFWLVRVYRCDLPRILWSSRYALISVTLAVIAAFTVGWFYASRYPLPTGAVDLSVPESAFENVPDVGFLPSFDVSGILIHNARVLLLEAVLGMFSFGTMAVVLLMVPTAIIGFFAGQGPALGASPWLLLGTFILPHGTVEMPAAIVATAMALRLGATVISPPSGMTLSQGVLRAVADLVKVFLFLVLPLLAVAAALEVWVTPWIVTRVW